MADILLTDLTNGAIATVDDEYVWQGTGIFDKLMEAVNSNVKVEYDNGRIVGEQYANVYLGGMQSVIAQSVQYVLQEKQTEAQIDLVNQQTLTETERTTLVREQAESEDKNNMVDGMIDNQIEKLKADVLIAQENILLAKAQLALAKSKAIADIDKTYGYNYSLDTDGNISIIDSSDNGKLDAEISLLKQQILTEINNTELVKEKTESEAVQNESDGILENQIEKLKADVVIAQEQAEIAKAQADKEYVQMLASLDKELGYSYTLDADGNVVKSSIASSGNGKLDSEVDLIKQQVLTETNNTELIREKTESEAKNNETDGVIDNQIEKMIKDVEIASQQLEISKTNSSLERAKALASISKEYGFGYEIDAQTKEISITSSTGNGKLDKELLLLTQQVSTEEYNTDLVQKKSESEAKNSQTDGVIDNQILKIKADVAIAQEQIDIAKAQSDKEYAQMIASIGKDFGYAYTFDGNGNIDRTSLSSSGEGKLDTEIDLLKQQVLTETNNTELVREKTESEAMQNKTDGVIDNQIEKLVKDVAIAEEQLSLSKAELALAKSKAIADIDKNYGYNYSIDADDNIVIGTSSDDGKLDAEISLVRQQVLTEAEKTTLVREQSESEDKNNMTNGVLDKQIQKIAEEVKLVTAQELQTNRKVL